MDVFLSPFTLIISIFKFPDVGTTAIKFVAIDSATKTVLQSLSYDVPHNEAPTMKGEQDPLLILRVALTGLKCLLKKLGNM